MGLPPKQQTQTLFSLLNKIILFIIRILKLVLATNNYIYSQFLTLPPQGDYERTHGTTNQPSLNNEPWMRVLLLLLLLLTPLFFFSSPASCCDALSRAHVAFITSLLNIQNTGKDAASVSQSSVNSMRKCPLPLKRSNASRFYTRVRNTSARACARSFKRGCDDELLLICRLCSVC